jgi:hypothetical protein
MLSIYRFCSKLAFVGPLYRDNIPEGPMPLGFRIYIGFFLLLFSFWPIYVIYANRKKKSFDKRDKAILSFVSTFFAAATVVVVFNFLGR